MEDIKAVLVTGASTGIGRKLTEGLAAKRPFRLCRCAQGFRSSGLERY